MDGIAQLQDQQAIVQENYSKAQNQTMIYLMDLLQLQQHKIIIIHNSLKI